MIQPNMSLAEIREAIAAFPVMLKGFDACLDRLKLLEGIAVGVKGSLIKSTTDRYSDLDLCVVVPQAEQFDDAREKVSQQLTEIGWVLANFPATHIGMPNLLINFIELDGEIVKLDVEIKLLSQVPTRADMSVIHDPGDILRDLPGDQPSGPFGSPEEFSDIYRKFSGWIWYTYTKIARGELLEAFDSLNMMRGWALLPCFQIAENIPREGYRYVEKRLSTESLEKLRATYPQGLERADLLLTLKRMSTTFLDLQPTVAQRLGRDFFEAEPTAILKAIDTEEEQRR
ncbi:MAG: nucleotidyltransferase domain-containing protein [Acidobacteriota bacterium]|nr:nucleotidyltransferase domain-containing protein [Acidobacteriota bacterium]